MKGRRKLTGDNETRDRQVEVTAHILSDLWMLSPGSLDDDLQETVSRHSADLLLLFHLLLKYLNF
jgi:hypothetical protein